MGRRDDSKNELFVQLHESIFFFLPLMSKRPKIHTEHPYYLQNATSFHMFYGVPLDLEQLILGFLAPHPPDILVARLVCKSWLKFIDANLKEFSCFEHVGSSAWNVISRFTPLGIFRIAND